MKGGIAQTPYIESTPAYIEDRKFAVPDLDGQVRDFLTHMASKAETRSYSRRSNII